MNPSEDPLKRCKWHKENIDMIIIGLKHWNSNYENDEKLFLALQRQKGAL